jgi:putative radical SAM enzyme (TIGR03279 family)
MNTDGLLIEYVTPGSIAAELDLESGDTLLMINGQPLRDIIDYNYLTADEELLFLVRKSNGDLWEIEFDKDESEPLGIGFPPPSPASCGNSCLFCFVHQLPRGLRKPLYVKDEDYRLSFLYGNYVTLTNLVPEELERIKEQRLSPLYISVHATEPELRQQLLGRTGLRPVLEIMEELAAARITMHTQVVLCPGLNDGAALEKTVDDLARLYPLVASLAVVPLGLTRHRRGLPDLRAVTEAYARDFIATWQRRQSELEQQLGEPFLFLADEFFIKGGVDFPPLETYGDLPQLENGVGMVPLFLAEAEEVLEEAGPLPRTEVTVVTGMSAHAYVSEFTRRLAAATGVGIICLPVENRLFGEQVTVTGLVTGEDLCGALQGTTIGGALFVPDVMLKEGEGLFLDDMSLAELAGRLSCRVEVFESSPHGFYRALQDFQAR